MCNRSLLVAIALQIFTHFFTAPDVHTQQQFVEVVGRSRLVSLDIFFGQGRAAVAFRYSYTTTRTRVLRASRTHTAVRPSTSAHSSANLHPLGFGGGGVPEIRRNNNNTWGGSHDTNTHTHTLGTRFSTTRNGMIQRTRTTRYATIRSGHNKRDHEIYYD